MMLRALSEATPSTAAGPVAALVALLDDLAGVLIAVPVDTYCARIEPPISGTIGEHVRHTLDHIAAIASSGGTQLSYDQRTRGTAVESDPSAALRHILRLKSALGPFRHRSLDDPILVHSMVAPDADTVSSWSSLGRELAFVVSHTIHHQALIAILLAWHSEPVPDGFGVAPSTPRH